MYFTSILWTKRFQTRSILYVDRVCDLFVFIKYLNKIIFSPNPRTVSEVLTTLFMNNFLLNMLSYNLKYSLMSWPTWESPCYLGDFCSVQTFADPEMYQLTGWLEIFTGQTTLGCTGSVITQLTGPSLDTLLTWDNSRDPTAPVW